MPNPFHSRLTALFILCPLLARGEPASLADLGIPAWTMSANLSLAAGFRDNLLLGPTHPEKSPLVRTELEFMANKVPMGSFDGYVYLNAVETRYTDGKSTDHERSAILAAEARWQPSTALKAGWTLQAYHQDQVFDVSATEALLSTALLQVTGAVTGPNIRWTIGSLYFEGRATGRRDRYRDQVDGYDETEASLRTGWRWAGGSEVSAIGVRSRRDHDSRPQFTSGGRPLSGSHLETEQREARLEWIQVFDAQRHFRLTSSASRQWSRDNGSGYFNFDRDLFRSRFAWNAQPWEAELGAEYGRYKFPVQLIGFGLEPEPRRKSELRFEAQITRHLGERWAVFLAAERENARSNDDRSRFTVNTIYAGVRFNWDNLGLDPHDAK